VFGYRLLTDLLIEQSTSTMLLEFGCTCWSTWLSGCRLPAVNALVRFLVPAMHLRFLDWYFSAIVLLVDVTHGTPAQLHNVLLCRRIVGHLVIIFVSSAGVLL